MHGYIGRTVEIIYMDRRGRFTQRVVSVRGAADGWVYAYCHARGEPRRFRVEHILAVRPAAARSEFLPRRSRPAAQGTPHGGARPGREQVSAVPLCASGTRPYGG